MNGADLMGATLVLQRRYVNHEGVQTQGSMLTIEKNLDAPCLE